MGKLNYRRVALPTDAETDSTAIVLHNLPWLVESFAKAHPSARVYLYLHNSVARRSPRWLIRRALRSARGVFFVSDFLRREFVERFGEVKGVTYDTIHHGVDVGAYFLADEPPEVDVVYVGRLIPEKGVHDLVSAVQSVDAIAAVRIVGGSTFYRGDPLSDYESSLRDMASAAPATIEFTGPVRPHEVPALMRSARVIAVPSRWAEPAGLVVLQALATGRRVVASRTGGIPELGGDLVEYFAPGDVDGLAKRLREALARDPLEDASHQVRNLRSWDQAYRDLLKCLAV
ncbi:glycosyltransferase family 4 protein [Microbacterium sp. F2]